MTGISMRYGAVQALSEVDFQVRSGTIHALVGENGAGKTTLMRVLYGAQRPDSGEIELDGARVHLSSSKQAIQAGVGMVSQHYGIIPDLTCLQNLILGAEGGAILRADAIARAENLATRMGFHFDWNRRAETLSPGGAQKLEILKLLWRNARIMILDEPTAMLSPADGETLFRSLRQLSDQGATVILVTHKLPEVIEHCSTVTVLRAGRRVAEKPVAETNARELAQLIVGGSIAEPPRRTDRLGEAVLDITDLDVSSPRGIAVKGASLSLKAGEIVGIAGVDGSGQRELFQAIAGHARPSRGRIVLQGQDLLRSAPRERISRGLRIIPEDRHGEGLIEEWPLEENSSLGLQRMLPFAKGPSIDFQGRRDAAARIADRFQTKHGGLRSPVRSLSGGNQQRFIAARALFKEPRLILAFQPARGLDLNGTTHVYDGIRQACADGAAALVVSFDLDELLEYCDRILAMYKGELFEPSTPDVLNREAIGRLMVGAA